MTASGQLYSVCVLIWVATLIFSSRDMSGCSNFLLWVLGIRICYCCAAMANRGSGQVQVWVSLVSWKSCCSDRKRRQEGASQWCSGMEDVRIFVPKKYFCVPHSTSWWYICSLTWAVFLSFSVLKDNKKQGAQSAALPVWSLHFPQ